jgi:hypothetical protein
LVVVAIVEDHPIETMISVVVETVNDIIILGNPSPLMEFQLDLFRD